MREIAADLSQEGRKGYNSRWRLERAGRTRGYVACEEELLGQALEQGLPQRRIHSLTPQQHIESNAHEPL